MSSCLFMSNWPGVQLFIRHLKEIIVFKHLSRVIPSFQFFCFVYLQRLPIFFISPFFYHRLFSVHAISVISLSIIEPSCTLWSRSRVNSPAGRSHADVKLLHVDWRTIFFLLFERPILMTRRKIKATAAIETQKRFIRQRGSQSILYFL